MAVQITHKAFSLHDPGLALGLLAYATAALSFMYQTHWHIGFSEFEIFVMPIVPWLINVALLLKLKAQPIQRYWWVLPSALLANPALLLIGLMMLAWSIGGFAP